MDGWIRKDKILKKIKCICEKISSKLRAIFLRSLGGNNICFVEWLSNIMDEWSGDTHFLCWSLVASLMCLVWPPPRLIWGPPPPTQPPTYLTDTHHCLQHPASLHHMKTLSKYPAHQLYFICNNRLSSSPGFEFVPEGVAMQLWSPWLRLVTTQDTSVSVSPQFGATSGCGITGKSRGCHYQYLGVRLGDDNLAVSSFSSLMSDVCIHKNLSKILHLGIRYHYSCSII